MSTETDRVESVHIAGTRWVCGSHSPCQWIVCYVSDEPTNGLAIIQSSTSCNKTTCCTPVVKSLNYEVSVVLCSFKMKQKGSHIENENETTHRILKLPFIMSWITSLGILPVRLLLFNLLRACQLWNKHVKWISLDAKLLLCLVWILKRIYQINYMNFKDLKFPMDAGMAPDNW